MERKRPAARLEGALVAWMLLVALALLLPAELFALPSWVSRPGAGRLDELVHGLLFFLVAVLFARWARPRFSRPIVVTLVFASLYGALLESLQIPLRSRSFEVMDILADVLGSCLGGIVTWLAWKR